MTARNVFHILKLYMTLRVSASQSTHITPFITYSRCHIPCSIVLASHFLIRLTGVHEMLWHFGALGTHLILLAFYTVGLLMPELSYSQDFNDNCFHQYRADQVWNSIWRLINFSLVILIPVFSLKTVTIRTTETRTYQRTYQIGVLIKGLNILFFRDLVAVTVLLCTESVECLCRLSFTNRCSHNRCSHNRKGDLKGTWLWRLYEEGLAEGYMKGLAEGYMKGVWLKVTWRGVDWRLHEGGWLKVTWRGFDWRLHEEGLAEGYMKGAWLKVTWRGWLKVTWRGVDWRLHEGGLTEGYMKGVGWRLHEGVGWRLHEGGWLKVTWRGLAEGYMKGVWLKVTWRGLAEGYMKGVWLKVTWRGLGCESYISGAWWGLTVQVTWMGFD